MKKVLVYEHPETVASMFFDLVEHVNGRRCIDEQPWQRPVRRQDWYEHSRQDCHAQRRRHPVRVKPFLHGPKSCTKNELLTTRESHKKDTRRRDQWIGEWTVSSYA